MFAVRERLERIRARIENAAGGAGRSASDVTLVAVTKGVPPQRILEACEAGLGVFGENKVQEASTKIPEVNRAALSALGRNPEWHMVGHLQSNKAKTALSLFRMIDSVDSVKLAKLVSAACLSQGTRAEVLLEVNLSGQAQRYGFSPEGIYAAMEAIGQMNGIRVLGLMGIAPNDPDMEVRRLAFKKLRNIYGVCRSFKYENVQMKHLSMGMSDDFEVAIEEGSNMIRLGRAIFGESGR